MSPKGRGSDLCSLALIESERKRSSHTTTETRYAISSFYRKPVHSSTGALRTVCIGPWM